MRGRRGGSVLLVAVVIGALAPTAPARDERGALAYRTVPLTMSRTARFAPSERARRLDLAFPPTHVAFSWGGSEGSRVLFRVAGAAWRRAPESHDLEHGARHYSGVITVARPRLLEWRAIAPDDGWIGRVTIDYLNTLDGRRVPMQQAVSAGAPNIVTRAGWGADESLKRTTGSCERRFFKVQQLFVHHTAGSNFDRHPKATMRAIYWFHTVRRGWCDIGYNFVISWDGRIFEGRWARRYKPWEVHSSEDRSGRAVAGAHVADFNSGSVGVSLMGNFSKVSAPPEMRRSLAEILAWEADRHDLAPLRRHRYRNPETGRSKRLPYIAGHRDAGFTECPGNLVYASMDDVRRDTKAAMGAGKTSTTMRLTRSAKRIVYGESVTFSGKLTDSSGVPLVAEPVTTYLREAHGSWKPGPVVTTEVDGSFSFSTSPDRRLYAAAVYGGDSSRWGSQSRILRVGVRAAVSLAAQGGTPDLTGTPHYPSATTSIPFSGSIQPPHSDHEVRVRVFEVLDDGTLVLAHERFIIIDTAGTFSYSFPVPGDDPAGTYRAVAAFLGDDDHAPGFASVTFVIDP
jgi:hypothetical protein